MRPFDICSKRSVRTDILIVREHSLVVSGDALDLVVRCGRLNWLLINQVLSACSVFGYIVSYGT